MSTLSVAASSPSLPSGPLGVVSSGVFVWQRERERAFYRGQIKDEIKILGAAYKEIELLAATDPCAEIAVNAVWDCAPVAGAEEVWKGAFSISKAQWRPKRCILSVKPNTDDPYVCFLKMWGEKHSVYDAGPEIPVRGTFGNYQVACCTEVVGTYAASIVPFTLPCQGKTPGEWCAPHFRHTSEVEDVHPKTWRRTTCFHRVVAPGASPGNPPAYGSGWTLLPSGLWFRCPGDLNGQVPVLRFGRRLDTVLQFLADLTDCGLTVRSHFFGIAATHAAPPANAAYGYATANLQDCTLHQKSDVKRPSATDKAQAKIWTTSLRQLLEDFRKFLNVWFKISNDGESLIVEHISYFQQGGNVLDLSAQNLPLEYEYDADAPQVEEFRWLDEETEPVRKIDYSPCGNADDTGETRTEIISTNVPFIVNIANVEVVSEAGFVLCANINDAGEMKMIDENAPLLWENLLPSLHMWHRPFGNGKIDGGPSVQFFSTERRRKSVAFSIKWCCEDGVFDPERPVLTEFGTGTVIRAEINYSHNTANIELGYD